MSLIQRFFVWILPKHLAHEMEMHSRAWTMTCLHCEHETSIWDMGGIRWRAYGNSRNYMKCISCGRRSWHRLHKKAEVPVPDQQAELDEIVNRV
jgi:hypothetical protein